MPFIKNHESDEFDFPDDDPEFNSKYEQFIHDLPYVYERPWSNCQIDARTFPQDLRAFYEALKTSGLTHLVVNYDGGCDEGFSTPDSFRQGDRVVSIQDAIRDLRVLPIASPKPSFFQKWFRPNHLQSYSPNQHPNTNRDLLYALAESVAVSVMGRGFGTGPYELYGRAVLDLASGRVSDDPQAPQPKHPAGFDPNESFE